MSCLLRWIEVDHLTSKFKGPAVTLSSTGEKEPAGASLSRRRIADEDIAFLQYTSGSTSEPKGVMISHLNLSHNEKLIQKALRTTSDTINVSWLPQFHDVRSL